MIVSLGKKHKWSISVFLWTVLLIPFLKPNGISHLSPLLSRIYDAGMIVSLVVIAFIIIITKESINKNIVFTAIFIIWIFGLTYFFAGEMTITIRLLTQCVGFALATHVLRDDKRTLFTAMFYNLEILIYINFLCVLIYPHGMYVTGINFSWNNWILGYDNHWFIIFFAAYCTAIMYAYYRKKIIRSILLITVMHICTFITDSGVLVVGMSLIDIAVVLNIYKLKLFNAKKMWIVAIISNIIMFFFTTNEYIHYFLFDILQKGDTSIADRLDIWEITIRKIIEKPICGYGHPLNVLRIHELNNVHGVNAHNFILEILYEGGLIGIGLFVAIIIEATRNALKYDNKAVTKVMLVGVLASSVTSSVDSLLEPRCALFFWMLSVLSCVNESDIRIRDSRFSDRILTLRL